MNGNVYVGTTVRGPNPANKIMMRVFVERFGTFFRSRSQKWQILCTKLTKMANSPDQAHERTELCSRKMLTKMANSLDQAHTNGKFS